MRATMRVLGPSGHTTMVCDLDTPDTTTDETVSWDEFERQFNSYVNDQRYVAFRVPGDGTPGERIQKVGDFKPETGESLLVFPPMAGG